MLLVKDLIYFLCLYLVTASPQINLHLTDDSDQPHDCLYFDATESQIYREIIPFCMSESSSKFKIEDNNFSPKFTFAELNQRNITSEQLYRWSAPVDISERYQLYLNQLAAGKVSPGMETHLFYNCSSFQFGSRCQYLLPHVYEPDLSLNNFISSYYQQPFYESEPLTCYIHLQCNRGPSPSCLDWSEICDGKVDCLDGTDEENCGPLITNECKDGEYRCDNGQCIPSIFVNDITNNFECLDRSDEYSIVSSPIHFGYNVPRCESEDIVCSWRKNRTKDFSSIYPFSSSCKNQRHTIIEQAILSDDLDPTIVRDCLLAFKCHSKIPIGDNQSCLNFCQNETCIEFIRDLCPDMFFYPTVPIAFGHIYFASTKQYAMNQTDSEEIPPEYICYNELLCDGFDSNTSVVHFKGMICSRPEDFRLPIHLIQKDWYSSYIRLVYSQLNHCNQMMHDASFCGSSMMYHCKYSSKCIPKIYVGDGNRDCVYGDDEEQTTINRLCSIDENSLFFKCRTENKCIHRNQLEDGKCDCQMDEYGRCDDENLRLNYPRQHITYSNICDGFVDLLPITVNGRNETDETECEQWPCNNTYTRCDGIWNCLDGADEINCDPSPSIQCLPSHHICIAPDTHQPMCLPIDKVNDGIIDCFGSIDEPSRCPVTDPFNKAKRFHCQNNGTDLCLPWKYVCDQITDCAAADDELFCEGTVNNFFRNDLNAREISRNTVKSNVMTSRLSTVDPFEHHCHRGFPIEVLLDMNKNLTTATCLCPPSYFGDRCQFQNQRVSLTMRINPPSSSQDTLFIFVISLIDNSAERIIHSYEQLSNLHMNNLHTKFNIHLTYSTQPKDSSKQYFVHIDIYEMITLVYRGSQLIPLKFPFLPVERIAVELDVPQASYIVQTCSDTQCVHGQCTKYVNDLYNTVFCQCQPGWSGKYCTIPRMCTCSLDSLCLGVTASNRSICVCPVNKFGSQCLLTKTACQHAPCENGGICVPSNEDSTSFQPYICLCPKGFHGVRCTEVDNKIILSFNSDIYVPSRSVALFHFLNPVSRTLRLHNKSPQIICGNEPSISHYGIDRIQIALVELSTHAYYLIVNQTTAYQSAVITRKINASDRCQPINDLFNHTIVQMPQIRCIKYYHLPCQTHSLHISCFYDDIYMCICNDQRFADCYEFNHSTQLDDFGIDNNKIERVCSTDSSTQPIDSSMSSLYTCAYLRYVFILIVCLYIH